MRRKVISALWTLIIWSTLGRGRDAVSHSLSSVTTNAEDSNFFNSLLPRQPKHDYTMVANVEGTLYLVDVSTRKLLWSFPTGHRIYSSYQSAFAEEDDTDHRNFSGMRSDSLYIDVGDDWELYVHNNGPFNKMRLPVSMDEYIKQVPYISNDGGVTLGSKNSTVFVVDAESGKLLRSYQLNEDRTGIQGAGIMLRDEAGVLLDSGVEDLKNVEHLLYIVRKDYVLQHKSLNTGKILWNLELSEFDAEFRCQNHNLLLPCEKKIVVHRLRDSPLLEHHLVLDRLESASGSDMYLLPSAFHKPALTASDVYPLALRKHDGSLVLSDKGALVLRSNDILLKNEERPVVVKKRRPQISGEELDHKDTMKLALPSTVHDDHEMKNKHILNAGTMNTTSAVEKVLSRLHGFPKSYLVTFLSIVCGFLYYTFSMKKLDKSNRQVTESNLQPKMLKRKKPRRSTNNKNGAKNDKNEMYMLSESKSEGSQGPTFSARSNTVTHADNVEYNVNGRRIGKLFVSNKEIAKGSNGTVVLEGIFDGRPVAVKRLVRTHHDVALKEIQNLIVSDQHPNIVRWYGVEQDHDFVYLALERCSCSLSDLIFMYSEPLKCYMNTKDKGPNEYNVQLHSTTNNVELWKANGYPSPQLLKLMRDVVYGLAHLHELGIIHRDLKPQNVLIIKEKILCAKISDMGISKRLPEDMSSLTQHHTGYGSSGWQAPEQIRHGRQTRAVDLFSLGCVLFFCVTGGKHPYGDNFERDINILNNQKDLFLVEHIPEAMDLFTKLLDPNPDMRSKATDVLTHPFFWNSEMRLSFLRDVSDRIELEDREKESKLLIALENVGAVAFSGKWDEKMEPVFINNIGNYRRYKFDSVRDLLRVVRNKLNHYRELPAEIQELLGPMPEGYYNYFSSRYPHLLIEVYKVMYKYCKEEEFFRKYIRNILL